MQEIVQKRGETSTEVRELMHTMLTGDTYTGLQAIKALGAIGVPAIGPLMEALTAADSNARWIVAMALACTRSLNFAHWAHSFLPTHYTQLLTYCIKTFPSSALSETGSVHIHHQSPVSNPVKESRSKDRIMKHFDPLG